MAAFDSAAAHTGSPSVIIADTRIGCGVPMLEQREKAHFMRVEAHEWEIARTQLDELRTMTTASTTATHPTTAGATTMPTTTKKRLTTSAMIASFADPGQATTPAPFGHALARLAEQRLLEIVGLSADLAKYTDMHIFRDAHPERFFQMGMSEQSMMEPPPASPRSGSSRSPPPTRSSPVGPTTSCASTSPSPA